MKKEDKYSEWLRGEMEARDISAKALAEMSGLSIGTIHGLRTGGSRPRLATAERIASALASYSSDASLTPSPERTAEDLFREAQEKMAEGNFRRSEQLARAAAEQTKSLEKLASFQLHAALMCNQYGNDEGAIRHVITTKKAYETAGEQMPNEVLLQVHGMYGWIDDAAGNFVSSNRNFGRALELMQSLDRDSALVYELQLTARHFRPRELGASIRAQQGSWFICPPGPLDLETRKHIAKALDGLSEIKNQGSIETRARNQALAFQLEKLRDPKSAFSLDPSLFEDAGVTHVLDQVLLWFDLGKALSDKSLRDLRNEAGKMSLARQRYAQLDHPTGVAETAGAQAIALELAGGAMPEELLDLWSVVAALSPSSLHPRLKYAEVKLRAIGGGMRAGQVEGYLESFLERIDNGSGPWGDVAKLATGPKIDIVPYVRAVLVDSIV